MKCPNCGKEFVLDDVQNHIEDKSGKKKKNNIGRIVLKITLFLISISLFCLLFLEHQKRIGAESRADELQYATDSARIVANIAIAEKDAEYAKHIAINARGKAQKAEEEFRRIEKKCSDKNVATNYTENAFNINMKMIWVEGGEFVMGRNDGQNDNSLEHKVILDGYYIGMLEVTQDQWTKIIGTTIEQQRDKYDKSWGVLGKGYDYPMYYVNWEEANEFCSKLSNCTNKKYDLPTEAQWEYAARGGKKGNNTNYSGSDEIDLVAWYKNNSNFSTHQCGIKRANELGIYDLSGNVWEWCKDWYGNYSSDKSKNPIGPITGSYRVRRGGGLNDISSSLVNTNRNYYTPDARSFMSGFRVVCNSTEEQKKLFIELEEARKNAAEKKNEAENAESEEARIDLKIEQYKLLLDSMQRGTFRNK